jgi:hypothetical protein
MHKRRKVITLHRETLRHLDAKDLNRVAGGFSIGACTTSAVDTQCQDYCHTYSCGPINCF